MDNKKLTIEELNYVQNEVKLKGKSVPGAYALTLLFWPTGANRAYLGKVKSAAVRIALSLATVVSFNSVIGASKDILTMNPEAIAAALNYNTALALLFIGLTTASVAMWIVELLSIPQWIKDINDASEEVATRKAIESRYVEKSLMKQSTIEHMMSDIKAEVAKRVEDEIESMVGDLGMKGNANVKMPALPPEDAVILTERAISDIELSAPISSGENIFKEREDLNSIRPDDIEEEYSVDIEDIPEDFTDLVEDDNDFAPIENINPVVKLTEDELKIKAARQQIKEDKKAFSKRIEVIEKEERLEEIESIKRGEIAEEDQVELVLKEIVDDSEIYENVKDLNPKKGLYDYNPKSDKDKHLISKNSNDASSSLEVILATDSNDENTKEHDSPKSTQSNIGSSNNDEKLSVDKEYSLGEDGFYVNIGEQIKLKMEERARQLEDN